jgi:hypothetical protein
VEAWDATNTVNTTMVKRRKVLIGAGSLIAGGAAATGTSAFNTASSTRDVEVRIAEDSKGYVGLYSTSSPYSSVSNGQVTLDFSEVEGRGEGSGIGTFDSGKGLNPDSTFNIDNVFRVEEREYGGQMRIVVTTSGFNLDDLEITKASNGKSLLAEDYDDADNVPRVDNGDGGEITADMTLETGDSPDMEAGGTITLHVATGGNQGDPAFSDLL